MTEKQQRVMALAKKFEFDLSFTAPELRREKIAHFIAAVMEEGRREGLREQMGEHALSSVAESVGRDDDR